MSSTRSADAKRILVVEDNPGYCELLQEALNQHGFGSAVQLERDADSASAWLHRLVTSAQQMLPALILLDLRLNGESGLQLLLRLRGDRLLAHIPVVIITTSDDPHDIDVCYAAGANGYVVKPGTFDNLTVLVGDLCHYWLNWNRCTAAAVLSREHSA